MTDRVDMGSITITYEIDRTGDMITGYYTEGDLPVHVQLGLLELTKDTILRTCDEG